MDWWMFVYVKYIRRRSSLLPTSQDAKFEEGLHMLSPVYPLQPQFPTRFVLICEALQSFIVGLFVEVDFVAA